MEEEIKVLEEFVKENRNWHCIECGYNCEKNMKTEQAIENLINKYKEQEKVIELMAEAIHDYEDWTDTVCNIVDCKNTPHCKAETKEQELDCIIDYFIKKAKGE